MRTLTIEEQQIADEAWEAYLKQRWLPGVDHRELFFEYEQVLLERRIVPTLLGLRIET